MTARRPDLHEVSELEFVIEHTIRATPERVFAAYTEPELIAQWWAHPGKAMRVDEMDVRPGGKWRFTHLLGEGRDMVLHGEYKEVRPVTRLSYTFNQGAGHDDELLAMLDLQPVAEGTLLRLTNRCRSREQRDAMVSYGAAAGAKATWQRLEEVLASG